MNQLCGSSTSTSPNLPGGRCRSNLSHSGALLSYTIRSSTIPTLIPGHARICSLKASTSRSSVCPPCRSQNTSSLTWGNNTLYSNSRHHVLSLFVPSLRSLPIRGHAAIQLSIPRFCHLRSEKGSMKLGESTTSSSSSSNWPSTPGQKWQSRTRRAKSCTTRRRLSVGPRAENSGASSLAQ
ncbi:hypothetical protein DACRYDRAFT_20925 [Dacryopinax primogenitus]|uniref:Uncharacterized protein n=1 Tax=Dacryopinax primogenitus (strain DJM 731) TaxID=1858805 RepID=M5G8A2_DACPD|nr:uncharacterized protein DACRYDRAFT_20925 [Dacryopinax primogenitus]EJU04375.1 hypothetical protein DACRYDRAFT_20925 [Dacryopinax primogenitus]